jgi:hypothetical protein
VETSSLPDGIRKIPTPLCFLLDPQPNIEQLAPGIVEKVAKIKFFLEAQPSAVLNFEFLVRE